MSLLECLVREGDGVYLHWVFSHYNTDLDVGARIGLPPLQCLSPVTLYHTRSGREPDKGSCY